MNKGIRTAAVLGFLAMAGFASPVMAQYSAWYVGGQLNYADYRGASERDTGWGALFGYEFTPNYALEAGYLDFGSISLGGPGLTAELGSTAVELAGLGAFEMGERVSMFGRLGVYRGDSTVDLSIFDPEEGLIHIRDRDRNTGISYGIGVRATFGNNLALRGSWTRYDDIIADTEVDSLSVAVLFRF